jgi:hypothetical protein
VRVWVRAKVRARLRVRLRVRVSVRANVHLLPRRDTIATLKLDPVECLQSEQVGVACCLLLPRYQHSS